MSSSVSSWELLLVSCDPVLDFLEDVVVQEAALLDGCHGDATKLEVIPEVGSYPPENSVLKPVVVEAGVIYFEAASVVDDDYLDPAARRLGPVAFLGAEGRGVLVPDFPAEDTGCAHGLVMST